MTKYHRTPAQAGAQAAQPNFQKKIGVTQSRKGAKKVRTLRGFAALRETFFFTLGRVSAMPPGPRPSPGSIDDPVPSPQPYPVIGNVPAEIMSAMLGNICHPRRRHRALEAEVARVDPVGPHSFDQQ